jgi:hypothetical protein
MAAAHRHLKARSASCCYQAMAGHDHGNSDPDGISARYARAEFPLKTKVP